MRLRDLQLIISRAGEAIGADDVIVIGSQAILASYLDSDLPSVATRSREADIAPIEDDAAETLATIIDADIGEMSEFDEEHGFYGQGVGITTATLPDGWLDRLVPVRGPGIKGHRGLCLDPEDLCLAKLAAGRAKDTEFVLTLVQGGFVDPEVMKRRVSDMRTADPRTMAAITAVLDLQIVKQETEGRPQPRERSTPPP